MKESTNTCPECGKITRWKVLDGYEQDWKNPCVSHRPHLCDDPDDDPIEFNDVSVITF